MSTSQSQCRSESILVYSSVFRVHKNCTVDDHYFMKKIYRVCRIKYSLVINCTAFSEFLYHTGICVFVTIIPEKYLFTTSAHARWRIYLWLTNHVTAFVEDPKFHLNMPFCYKSYDWLYVQFFFTHYTQQQGENQAIYRYQIWRGFPIDGCLRVYCTVLDLSEFPIAVRKSDEF